MCVNVCHVSIANRYDGTTPFINTLLDPGSWDGVCGQVCLCVCVSMCVCEYVCVCVDQGTFSLPHTGGVAP